MSRRRSKRRRNGGFNFSNLSGLYEFKSNLNDSGALGNNGTGNSTNYNYGTNHRGAANSAIHTTGTAYNFYMPITAANNILTISTWFYYTGTYNTYKSVFQAKEGTTLRVNSRYKETSPVSLNLGQGTGDVQNITISPAWVSPSWHHITAQYQQVSSNIKLQKVHIDSIDQSIVAGTYIGTVSAISNLYPLNHGGARDSGLGVAQTYIFTRFLSDAEINEIYLTDPIP